LPEATAAPGLLVVSSAAGSVSDAVVARLRSAFPDHAVVEFDPHEDLRARVPPGGQVVVAGGDGTTGFVLRALAGTRHPVGLLALGTYNNFARALSIPEDLEEAIEVVRHGVPRPVTLGRVGGRPFLEVAAVGLFGEAIALGEAAKDRVFGELADHFRGIREAPRFRYRLRGDLRSAGTVLSLVFSNTPTTGAGLAVGGGTPEEPYLELSRQAGGSRLGLLGGFLTALLRGRRPRAGERNPRFRRLVVETRPPVPVYADGVQVGRTPTTVEAVPRAVTVIVPRHSPGAGGA